MTNEDPADAGEEALCPACLRSLPSGPRPRARRSVRAASDSFLTRGATGLHLVVGVCLVAGLVMLLLGFSIRFAADDSRRRVGATLTILDAATGLPVRRFNLDAYKLLENGKREHICSLSLYSEKGQATLGTEPGDIVVVVEAPGYHKAGFTLNVPQRESWQQNPGLQPAPTNK